MLVNDPLLLHHKIGEIFAHDLTFIQDLMPLLLAHAGRLDKFGA